MPNNEMSRLQSLEDTAGRLPGSVQGTLGVWSVAKGDDAWDRKQLDFSEISRANLLISGF